MTLVGNGALTVKLRRCSTRRPGCMLSTVSTDMGASVVSGGGRRAAQSMAA